MRINTKITLTSGTPINIAVALGLMTSAQLGKIGPIYADRLLIQMAEGGTKTGYVLCLDYNPTATPSVATVAQVCAQLLAATVTDPGGSYSDTMFARDGGGIILNNMWVDGDANDPVLVSANVRM